MARKKKKRKVTKKHLHKALGVVKKIHGLSKNKRVRHAVKQFHKFTQGNASVDSVIKSTSKAAHSLCKGPKCRKTVKTATRIAGGINRVGKFIKKHKGLKTAASAAALLL
jgi:hypothetical protein